MNQAQVAQTVTNIISRSKIDYVCIKNKMAAISKMIFRVALTIRQIRDKYVCVCVFGVSVFGCGHQITEITVCPALRYSRLKHAVLTPHSTETIQTLLDGCYRRAMRRRCQTRESNINFATKTDKVWQTTYCGGTSCRFLHLSLHTITIHTNIGYIQSKFDS